MRERHRQRDREREKDRDRQTETERERQREKETSLLAAHHGFSVHLFLRLSVEELKHSLRLLLVYTPCVNVWSGYNKVCHEVLYKHFSDYKINDSANRKFVTKLSSFSYNVYTGITLHLSNQYL